ncbi:hypothetical protein EW146_g4013 [Bondarzewia mesenterica]|uniref:Uncharacterized protein n=1 Tax=Bondarzewia mesenterica TaxID=1095465 RepID=A0A4S4M1M9_9AGAM|nr:hypothetical protein EW146_g4013 [Bondarzewia mesenterica]
MPRLPPSLSRLLSSIPMTLQSRTSAAQPLVSSCIKSSSYAATASTFFSSLALRILITRALTPFHGTCIAFLSAFSAASALEHARK